MSSDRPPRNVPIRLLPILLTLIAATLVILRSRSLEVLSTTGGHTPGVHESS